MIRLLLEFDFKRLDYNTEYFIAMVEMMVYNDPGLVDMLAEELSTEERAHFNTLIDDCYEHLADYCHHYLRYYYAEGYDVREVHCLGNNVLVDLVYVGSEDRFI